jgi:hypothetical protein
MLIPYCRPYPVLRYKADPISDEFLSEMLPGLPLELVVLIRDYTGPRRLSCHDDRYRHLYHNYRNEAVTEIRQESWWKIRIDLRHLSYDGRKLRHCVAILRWTDYVETPPKKCLTYFFVNQNTGEWSCRGETIKWL